ncbi:MAG: hypothetical protein LBD43_02410, partial [Holosporales bacterium]|nr:hypothetical protein [Holosporales bacterium]
MDISFLTSINAEDVGAVVVVVTTKDSVPSIVDRVKSLIEPGCVDAAFAAMTGFKYGNTEGLTAVSTGVKRELLIVSAGDRALFSRASFEKLGGRIFDGILAKEAKVTILNTVESTEFPEAAAYIASGISLKSWTFDKYKTIKADRKISSIVCETGYVDENTKVLARLDAVKEGVFTVRSMATEPANVMTTDQVVAEARKLKSLGVEITVLDRKNMESFGMHALLGVGQGSAQPSYSVIMEYKGSNNAPIALVGKGLTFDSGGICVKPANRMGEMKEDMTGAAVVIGAIEAIASQKLKTNVVGCIGVVENMISGNAQRPGDVVTSMSGKTIEV